MGRRRSRRNKLVFIMVEVMALLVVAAVAFGFFYVKNLWDKVETADFDAAEIVTNVDLNQSIPKVTETYTTIAVFGIDARDSETLSKGALSDTNILICINNDTREICLISIYRDLYVEDTRGDHGKLTEVYHKYGALEQINTINKNLDLNITQYVTVNWKAVADAIDLLGGLDISLTVQEAEGINQYVDEVIEATGISSGHIPPQAGTQHLDGVQAVTYCRLRNTAGSDYKRTERQRQVLELMLAQAKAAGVSKLTQICNTVFPGISTNLKLSDLISMAGDVSRYTVRYTAGFPFRKEDRSGGGKDYVYSLDLEADVKELHSILYDNQEYTVSSTVKRLSKEMKDKFGD